jgi:hypothetical protein
MKRILRRGKVLKLKCFSFESGRKIEATKKNRQSLPWFARTGQRLPGKGAGPTGDVSGVNYECEPKGFAIKRKHNLKTFVRQNGLQDVVFAPDDRGNGEHAMVREGGDFGFEVSRDQAA